MAAVALELHDIAPARDCGNTDFIHELERKVDALTTELAEKKQDNSDLRKKMFSMQRMLAEKEQSNENKVYELSESIRRLKEINADLEQHQAPEAEFRDMYCKILVSYEESERSRKECVNRLQEANERHDREVSRLTAEREQLLAEMEENGEAVPNDDECLKCINSKLARENEELALKVAKEKERGRKLVDELSMVRDENEMLMRTHSEGGESQNEILRQAVERADMREMAMTLELEKVQRRCKELEAKVETVGLVEPDRMRDEITYLRLQNASKEDTLAGITAQLRVIRDENARLRKRVKSAADSDTLRTSLKMCERTIEKLKAENECLGNEISRLKVNLYREVENGERLEKAAERYKNQNASHIAMLSRQNELLIEENQALMNNEDRLSRAKMNDEIQRLTEELNETKYAAYEFVTSKTGGTSIECHDVIRVLQKKLDDSEMIHRKSLRERDEIRKASTLLSREVRELRVAARNARVYAKEHADIMELQDNMESLNKRLRDNEAFKQRMLNKMKELKEENNDLKRKMDSARLETDNYRFQLADMKANGYC